MPKGKSYSLRNPSASKVGFTSIKKGGKNSMKHSSMKKGSHKKKGY